MLFQTGVLHPLQVHALPIGDLAADVSSLQDVIVGGAVVSAMGAALYNGLKVCSLLPTFQVVAATL